MRRVKAVAKMLFLKLKLFTTNSNVVMSIGLVLIDSVKGLPFVQDGYDLIHMNIGGLISWISTTYGSVVRLELIDDGTCLLDLMQQPASRGLQDLMDEYEKCTELWIEAAVVRHTAATKKEQHIASLKANVDAAQLALKAAITALAKAEG